MAADYLHNHSDFKSLIQIIAEEKSIEPALVEKDYWIMHVLYGLKKQGFTFELKGGTSLSKGFKIIERFSEDIDVHIEPPPGMNINQNPKNCSDTTIKCRREFYDYLTGVIMIEGILSVKRDTEFDDTDCYRSGGIRLHYESFFDRVEGLKEGLLLEAGFTTVSPNRNLTIDSWSYDRAASTSGVNVIDNRAMDIACYLPGYTFVEKLQTIATKYRNETTGGKGHTNFMRQYYDVSCLLDNKEVQDFIATPAYAEHKEKHFPKADLHEPIAQNQAFMLSDEETLQDFKRRYLSTSTLYYNGQPEFDSLIDNIGKYLDQL